MAYFNRDTSNRSGRDNRGGGRGFGGRGRDSARRNDGPREMFKTVCSSCGKECEVPFKPTNGKPVYCSDCFEKIGGRNSDGPRPERPERNRSDFSNHQQTPRIDNTKVFEDLNKKLDKIIELLTPKVEVVAEKPAKVVKAKKAKVVEI